MYESEARLEEAVRDLRFGDGSPSTRLDSYRRRVEAVEPEIQAFVEEEDRQARVEQRLDELESTAKNGRFDATRQAGEATSAGIGSLGPLYGIPVGVKDIFNVDGVSTRAGSTLPPSAFDGPESIAWQRLEDAGAVLFGKTVTTEFAYFAPGPTANPHDPTRTPGGSSSGSAAAVAAGEVPLAIGTQTIGSVIRPAAFCGIIGVKPSYGRIPTEGVVPVSPSLDHVGYFTQDVAGAQLAASVLCDDWEPLATPSERPTLGVPSQAYLDQAESVGIERFERQLDVLADAGYEIHRTDVLADIDDHNERHQRLMAAEMAVAHREHGWLPKYADEYADETLELIEDGDDVSAATIGEDRSSRFHLREDLQARMLDRDIDIWVSPAAPGPAPKGLDDTGDPTMNLPWTNAGVPTVTLPVDETAAGLPLGLQCSARFGADEALLAWAELLAEDLGLLTASE